MNIELPDYAKDIQLNLSSLFRAGGTPGLDGAILYGTALASAIASGNAAFARRVEEAATQNADPVTIKAAKSAAAIMGMNNIYYRFLHLVEDKEYGTLPAKLRMNGLRAHGIDQKDFELMSLAVSAVNGCGLCLTAHEHELKQAGVSREAVQSAVRVAAVVHAAAKVLSYEA